MYLETSNPCTAHFYHYLDTCIRTQGKNKILVEQMVTECRVHLGACREKGCQAHDLGEGFAECSPKDMFVKKIGRKIALARALSALDKNTRSEIWAAYFTKTPKSR